MGKRNQVTTELKISADAQLKTSRNFINQLDKITSKLDINSKLYGQLEKAKDQLKDINKILGKVGLKSIVSDEELKNITKAGKEVLNIIAKTEKIYKNFSSNDLQKMSKEYVKQLQEQEKAIAKIKNEYTAKTGKNFDKEIANYDKLKIKIKELNQEKRNLTKNGTTNIVTKEIEQLNKKLEEQKSKLIDIKKLQQQSSSAYNSTLNQESKKRGYSNYNELKNIKILNENQIRKQLGNTEYKEQANLISNINKQVKELENSKKETNVLDKNAITLAKQYQIENVSSLQTLKEQLKIKKDILSKYKSDKSTLANEKLVTAELEKQRRIANDKVEVETIAKQAELNIIQKGGYNSKASLSATASATNKSINNLTSQLTESGIETITNNAANIIAGRLDKLNSELEKANGDLSSIDEANKKIATQSERVADESDILKSGNNTVEKIANEEIETRNVVRQENQDVKRQIIAKESLAMGKELEKALQNASDLEPTTRLESFDGQQNIFTNEVKQQLQKIQDSYDFLVDDLKRKGGQLKTELTTEEYEEITQGGLQNLAQAKSLVNEMARIIKHTKAQEMASLKQRQDEMIKHNSKGEKRFEGNNPILKSGHSIEQYNETVQQIKQLSEEYRELDKVQTELNVEFTEGENQLRNFNGILKTHNTTVEKSGVVNLNFTQTAEKNALAMTKAGDQAKYLGSALDDFKNKAQYFLSLNYALDFTIRTFKQANSFIKTLDKDMVQIGLVLEQTSAQVWKNFNTYSSMANRLSTTTTDVTGAMKLFYQQGLKTAEVNKMVEASAIAAALGESTMAEASETLTSIINSYNLSANEALNVTDKISQVAIVSAADFGELSLAIEKVASQAATVGLDLDHMMGYLGKMIETTREAPTNIGTALKTILANFAQFKEDPTATLEDGADINKVDAALQSIGIQLTNTNGEMRDLGVVIDELGQKWGSLTRNQKSYIATQAAGTRQQSRFYALMNDYERTVELVEEANNSAGKSTEQFILYQDSLTGATARLKNQFEVFYGKLVEGDGLLKNFANAGTTLLKVINQLGPKTSILVGFLGLKGARSGINILHEYNNKLKETLNNIISTSGLVERAQGSTTVSDIINNQQFGVSGTNKIGQMVANKVAKNNGLQQEVIKMQELLKVQNLLKDSKIEFNDILKEQIANLGISTLTTESLANANKAEVIAEINSAVATTGDAVAKKSATVATKGLIAANLALTGGLVAIGWLVGKAVEAFTHLINKHHENALAAEENAKASKEEYKTLEENIDRYKELSSKVITTKEEKEELKNANEELLKQSSDLIKAIDGEGNAYLSTNKALDDYLKKKEKAMIIDEAEAAKAKLNDNKIKSTPYNDKTGWNGASPTEENYISSNTQSAAQRLQTTVGNMNTYKEYLSSIDQDVASTGAMAGTVSAAGGTGALIGSLGGPIGTLVGTLIGTVVGGITSGTVVQDAVNKNILSAGDAQDLLEEALATGKREEIEKALNEIGAYVSEGGKEAFETYRNNVLTSFDEWQDNLENDYIKVANSYFGQKIYDAGLTDEENNVITTLLNKKFKEDFKGLTEEEIKTKITSGELDKTVSDLLVAVENLTVDEIESYTQWLKKYQNGEYSYNELEIEASKLNTTVQPVTKDYLTELNEILNQNAEILNLPIETLRTWSKTRLEKISNQWNTMDASEQEEFKTALNQVKNNEGFWKDYDNLNESNASEIAAFKNKYNEILGEYGENFFNLLLQNPEYNAEKITEGLNSAISTFKGAGTTTSGASMTDVALGQSQEGALGILSSEDETRAQNLLVVGNKLMVSAEEISDSYKQAFEDITNYTSQISLQAEQKISDNIDIIRDTLDDESWEVGDNINFDSLNQSQQETIKNAQKAISNLQRQKQTAEELAAAYKKLDAGQQANIDFAPFRNGTIAVQSTVSELQNLAEVYEKVKKGAYSYLDVVNWIANDTSGQLLAALEVENGQLNLNANTMEILAEAKKQETLTTIDGLIAKAEGQLYYLENVDTATEGELADIKSIDEAKEKLSQNDVSVVSSMGTNWANFTTSFAANAKTIIGNIVNMIKSFVSLKKAETEGVDDGNATGGGGTGKETKTSDANTDNIDIEGRKKTLKENIKRLKALRSSLSKMNGKDLLKGINNIGGDSKGGGSKDKFETVVEKLEKFYNYMRKLEKIEAKINRIREKRNIIDATKNYYVDDLKKENNLLKDQQDIYSDYVADQDVYLKQLQQQIKGKYSKWAYFDENGTIQLKQTEFTAKSEKEEKKLNTFLELVELYQEEYNTREENINKLYELEATQLENIRAMYDKVLQKVNDITEALDRQNGLFDHKSTMAFSNSFKIDIVDGQSGSASDALNDIYGIMKALETQANKLNKEVNNGAFKELLTWDENLQHWIPDEKALQSSKTKKKYEKMGYDWDEVTKYVREVSVRSEEIRKTWLQSQESAHSFSETLRGIVDERIGLIEAYYDQTAEEINKILNTFNEGMEDIDTQNNLFGVSSETLEEKYGLLVNASTVLKQSLAELKSTRGTIIEKIQKEYPDYIDLINGVATVNKQAIEESTTLSNEDKGKLLQFYGVLEAADGKINELEDQLVEYFNTMMQMEEERRDATIDLKQSVHDELMSIDQEEIDDLRSKYDKMSELDNEYYSELTRRVNDARNLRAERQESTNIQQMQARLATLKADSSGAYNSEVIELQRQLNEALQTQADNEVDRELERIQREQQEREKDRQLQITAMENVMTFKDENGLYWQAANTIWGEGEESVLGLLKSSKEYENQSEEARQKQFEDMQNTVNTAFATLTDGEGSFRKKLQTFFSTELPKNAESTAKTINDTLGVKFDTMNTTMTTIKTNLFDGETSLLSMFKSVTKKYLDTSDLDLSGLDEEGKKDGVKENKDDTNTGKLPTVPTKEEPKKEEPKKQEPKKEEPKKEDPKKKITVNGKVKASKDAKIFTSATDKSGSKQFFSSNPKYKVLKIQNKRAKLRHVSLNSGTTGWMNLSDLTAYKKGGYVDYTGLANVHGSANNPEAFLNAKQTRLFEVLRDGLVKVSSNRAYNANNEKETTKEEFNIDNVNIEVQQIADVDTIEQVTKKIKAEIYKDAIGNKNNMAIRRR